MLALLALGSMVACSSGGSSGGDTSADTAVPDTALPDTSDAADTTPPQDVHTEVDTSDAADTTSPPDAPDVSDTPDVSDVSAPDGDATGPGPVTATPGARCDLSERIGLVRIDDWGSLYLNVDLMDRVNPQYGAPELTTAQCAFHRESTLPCSGCDETQVCGRAGSCEAMPLPRKDAALRLIAGEDEQVFTADPTTGELWGQINLSSRELGAVLTFGDIEVRLSPMAVPGPLEGLSATLKGDYSEPEELTVTWTPASGDSWVFTHVPMNHHVGGPTFTECRVSAAEGTLTIGGDMLAPLSLVTGLEFQGTDHARFASAETPLGCVEFAFMVRQFPSF